MVNTAVVFAVLLIINENKKALGDSNFMLVSTTKSPYLTHGDVNKLNLKIEALEKEIGSLRNALNAIQQKEQNVKTTTIPKNCKELKDQGYSLSGIYSVQPRTSTKSFIVFCDMTTKLGGWTIFLNRLDGSQEFERNWNDYKEGFGNLAKEFWLGLEQLHLLTADEPNELLIELVDWNSNKVSAKYTTFSIGSESEGYNIKVLGDYSGDAGDSLRVHAGMKFSTYDKDQDLSSTTHCADYYGAAWWFQRCGDSDLNGKYRQGKVDYERPSVMFWSTFRGFKYSLKEAKMMVRPTNNRL